MLTLVKTGSADNSVVNEYRGLSTDTKPTTDVPNGSIFIEIDTGNIYFYDSANNTWIQWGS